MKFKAKILKAGVNPYVDVPERIVKKLKATRGYIRIKGVIEKHSFTQTLVPVRSDRGRNYRLYVNGPMLKGSKGKVGEVVLLDIEQNQSPKKMPPMAALLKGRLIEENLMGIFKGLTPSRQLEILRYLNHLKNEETVVKNVDRVIRALRGKEEVPYVRVK